MQPTISHVGIAVRDVAAAARFYREVLGVSTRGPDISDGARIVHLDFGGAAVELLEPVEPDSPIARFLERRGPGIHHICYRVTDLDDAVRRCREQGYALVDEAPRPGAGGRRVVFLHPKSTDGVLVELTE